MGTIKLVAGTSPGASWATVGAVSNINTTTIAGDSVIVSTGLDNSGNLDLWMDVSFSLASITPGSGTPYIGVGVLPLNQDGSSYGPGTITSSASANGIPSEGYVGAITLPPGTAGVVTGMVQRIRVPFGAFAICIYNGSGATLVASGSVIKYRTYSLQD